MHTLASSNAEAIQQIAAVYIPDGSLVLDGTYGKGRFWAWEHNLNLTSLDIVGSPAQIQGDFRCLPFRDETFDACVFDPPYYGHGTQMQEDSGTSNQLPWFLRRTEPTRNLYMRGLLEASRVTKNRGIVVVKCTDGCDYHPMLPWVTGLRIGRFLDTVIRTNPSLRNWAASGNVRKKLRTCHSYFIVLQNSYYGRT